MHLFLHNNCISAKHPGQRLSGLCPPQERQGVAVGPAAAQQGGDDERRRPALPAAAGRGVPGLLLGAAGQGGGAGEGQPHHGPQPRPVPLRPGRSEVVCEGVNRRLLQAEDKHCPYLGEQKKRGGETVESEALMSSCFFCL